jgi:hypothetical protein
MDEAERCARAGYVYHGDLLAVGTPDELKCWPGVTPVGTQRWEIVGRGAEIPALLERLRNLPGVREATIFGQTVRALLDADQTPESLGLDGWTIRPAEPTLEDVFVTLSKARTQATG